MQDGSGFPTAALLRLAALWQAAAFLVGTFCPRSSSVGLGRASDRLALRRPQDPSPSPALVFVASKSNLIHAWGWWCLKALQRAVQISPWQVRLLQGIWQWLFLLRGSFPRLLSAPSLWLQHRHSEAAAYITWRKRLSLGAGAVPGRGQLCRPDSASLAFGAGSSAAAFQRACHLQPFLLMGAAALSPTATPTSHSALGSLQASLHFSPPSADSPQQLQDTQGALQGGLGGSLAEYGSQARWELWG